MNKIRYLIFKGLSRLGWWICPKEDKIILRYIWKQGFDRIEKDQDECSASNTKA